MGGISRLLVGPVQYLVFHVTKLNLVDVLLIVELDLLGK